MKKIITLLVFIFLTKNISSQEIDSLVFTNISKQLIDKYLENYYLSDKNIERREDCIFGKEEGFTLSCLSAYWDINWVTDFDGDSINDLIIQITDEGLGGGGNAFGYDFNIVTLDKNQKIKNVYSLFGGGKMSYALLSIDKVNNGKIYATYEQNPYGYGFKEVTFKNKETLALEFLLENDIILDKNYKKCPIAEMNKNIFKKNINFKIDRKVSLNGLYNIEQEEQLYLKDKTHYYASISGCEDINLYFTHTTSYKQSLEKDKAKIKDIWLEHISFLKENTRYKTVFSELYTKLIKLEIKNIELQEYGEANNEITLNNNWKAFLFTSRNEEQGSFITIKLIKSVKTEPLNFWESLKRKNNW